MRYRAPIGILSLLLATLAAAGPAAAGPRDVSSGQGSGKVNVQDLHFSSRAEAATRCPGGVADQPDGSFACSASSSAEPAGMAINEKGTAGTKPKPTTPK
ncbi:hypothetical protein KX816_02145 [Sphingosinicellaceae bacterium]|nr:hypothetical protein KX816_02145 [Sphingosinicellaceae bacterium]